VLCSVSTSSRRIRGHALFNRCDQASSTPRHQLVTSLLRFVSEGSNLVVLSTSLHCLRYVGIISSYRRGSNESLSKSNNGRLG
ncbi:unnamed protein product, partial [Brassica rapa subsp. narinosa]